MVDQESGGLPGSLHVVGGHMVRPAVRGAGAEADEGIFHVKVVGGQVVSFRNGQDHTIRDCGVEVGEQSAHPGCGVLGVRGHVDGISLGACRVDDLVGELCQVWGG